MMSVLKMTIQAAQIENKTWKQELYTFLRNYRATPHSTTGVSPAEALCGRKIKTRLPDVSTHKPHGSAPLDDQIRRSDYEGKKGMKDYADNRRRSTVPDVEVGDVVLARQSKDNKLTPKTTASDCSQGFHGHRQQ